MFVLIHNKVRDQSPAKRARVSAGPADETIPTNMAEASSIAQYETDASGLSNTHLCSNVYR